MPFTPGVGAADEPPLLAGRERVAKVLGRSAAMVGIAAVIGVGVGVWVGINIRVDAGVRVSVRIGVGACIGIRVRVGIRVGVPFPIVIAPRRNDEHHRRGQHENQEPAYRFDLHSRFSPSARSAGKSRLSNRTRVPPHRAKALPRGAPDRGGVQEPCLALQDASEP
jgi:hypothetical protein